MTIETTVRVPMDRPRDVASLAKRTGYTEEEVETYLWNAEFAKASVLILPIKRDLNLSKL